MTNNYEKMHGEDARDKFIALCETNNVREVIMETFRREAGVGAERLLDKGWYVASGDAVKNEGNLMRRAQTVVVAELKAEKFVYHMTEDAEFSTDEATATFRTRNGNHVVNLYV